MAETTSELTREQKTRQEGQRLLFDTCKHLTTLSTGSIVLLATFLEKFFTQDREWTVLVAVVFVGLTVAMVSATVSMFILSKSVFYLKEENEPGYPVGTVAITISIVGFLLGVGSLVIFVLKNFY